MAYHESKSATYEHISSPAISPDESIAIHPIRQSAQSNPLTKKEISLLAKRFSGKLLLRQEIEMDEVLFSHLVSIHAFRPVPSIITSWKGETCQRCGNQSKALFAAMPCRKCQKRCIYCRKCIEMGRVLACQPLYEWTSPTIHWPSIKDPCSWRGSLTAAQEYASNRLIQALHERGEMLVWAVCGAGKTEMLFPVITEALKQGKRICIATPRADVVRELKPRLLQAFPKVSIQALYGGSEDKTGTAQLIIATTHQLLRFKAAFDVMIIDEIDAFPYNKDASLPFASNRAKKSPSTTIYLTATPRKEHQLLIQKKQLPHVFVPVRYHGHPLPVPQLKMSFSLQKDLKRHHMPSAFVTWLRRRKNPGRQLLLFVPTIGLAKKLLASATAILEQEMVIEGPQAIRSVHAEDPDREEIVQQFRRKELKALITTTILERGVTFPSVDVAILDAGHDVFDEAALVQISGRAGRSADDPTGEVIFFHDGKTKAMLQAIAAIQKMNRKAGF